MDSDEAVGIMSLILLVAAPLEVIGFLLPHICFDSNIFLGGIDGSIYTHLSINSLKPYRPMEKSQLSYYYWWKSMNAIICTNQSRFSIQSFEQLNEREHVCLELLNLVQFTA